VGALPTRNHQDVQFEGAKDISAEAMATPRKTDGKKQLVTNQACFGCTIACGRISKMDEGHFTVANKPQYWGASGGLEYEAAWALGAANGVNDLEALQYANMICNEECFDPISFGATIGAVMELYEMGVLTKEQIGVEAPFGSAEALCEFVDMTAKGIGFGKEIGMGSKRLTAKYGHPDLSMSSKGQEFPAYDGRAIQGIGLAYATSNRGGCHLRGYTIASEVLGIPVKTEPTEHEGKPELVKAFQDADTLSGGEKTKLALAQLVVGGHNLLLLDEPTNNLDPPSRESVADALSDWKGSIVFVSHDTEFVERLSPTKVLLMPDGQVDYFNEGWLELVSLA
jgi:aldehyde:ferredoxin oxidoreductase